MISEVNANDYKVAEVLLKFSAKGRHTLPGSIDFFHNLYQLTKIYATNYVQSWFWWTFSRKKVHEIVVLMVLTHLYPILYYNEVRNQVASLIIKSLFGKSIVVYYTEVWSVTRTSISLWKQQYETDKTTDELLALSV